MKLEVWGLSLGAYLLFFSACPQVQAGHTREMPILPGPGPCEVHAADAGKSGQEIATARPSALAHTPQTLLHERISKTESVRLQSLKTHKQYGLRPKILILEDSECDAMGVDPSWVSSQEPAQKKLILAGTCTVEVLVLYSS